MNPADFGAVRGMKGPPLLQDAHPGTAALYSMVTPGIPVLEADGNTAQMLRFPKVFHLPIHTNQMITVLVLQLQMLGVVFVTKFTHSSLVWGNGNCWGIESSSLLPAMVSVGLPNTGNKRYHALIGALSPLNPTRD